MAEIRIGAEQFRRQLTDLLNRTSYGQEHVIIERHGSPLAALIPYDLYEALMAAGIPKRLTQLEESETGEVTDLVAALDAILAQPTVTYATREAQTSTTPTTVREVADAYLAHELSATNAINQTLTLEEAAMYLKLPIDTVAEQAAQGMIPGRKINQTWRFLRAAIDNWLRSSNGRQILLDQAGVFADDDSLAALREQIYAERGRPEIDPGPTETV
ncbi:MAG: type II toxin-antitoxin system prevent-host-death family antitoxin [Caldilineaceae bacterium]|nr:type II toxin-antitoxin system prevent-host-death family antitoxin [Caldilineaceae bacterium]MCB0082936.1 type II toxin-antitoxin system prevent-host-death family antitoxin [Caldilineaceae bacterium]